MRWPLLRRHWFDVVWVVFWTAFGGIMANSAARHLSGTFDESFYLRAGLQHWRTGSTFDLMRAGTMPLPVDAETFAPYVWERMRGREWNLDTEFDQALAMARIGNLVFWFLLLVYGWRIARSLGGVWAGRLAVVGLAIEPNLLAHASLATTDLAIAACLFVFCVHYRAGRDGAWVHRVGMPGLCYGFAILAKASGLVFVPICVLAIEFERLWRASHAPSRWQRTRETIRQLFSRRFLKDCAAIGMLGLALTYLWCGSDWLPHPKIVAAAQNLPENSAKPTFVWLAEHFAIFNNAGMGLWYQIQHNSRGHGAYLLGSVTESAFWYYFPVALSMKLALPYLAAVAVLLATSRRLLFNWVCIACGVLLAFSINCRVQIGVRLQFPLIALAVVGLAVAIGRILAEASHRRRLVVGLCAFAGLGWTIVSDLQNWPDGICYINELWGGPTHGERLLCDSNFDWWQGLKELDRWRLDHGQIDIAVWYFGTDPSVDKPPFRSVPLHVIPVNDEKTLRQKVGRRYLAVSTTILFSNYLSEPAWLLNRLRSANPADRTRTFLIFDMQDSPDESRPNSAEDAQFANRNR